MKGTVYSGIAYMPEHPDADMHGMVRLAVRTCGGWLAVRDKLGVADISSLFVGHIWQESKSHVEHQATEKHYGELLACPLALQYTTPDKYKPLPKRTGVAPPPPLVKSGLPPRGF